jgi:CO/xanthine dehydrogenase FAD-binding subunit
VHLEPRSVAEAVSLLADTGATVLAGGTDFYPALGDRPLQRPVLDVARIAGLRGIVRDGGTWRINAGATWTDLARTGLPRQFDGLVAAARELGSIQIQNAATIAGNICNASPAADGVPCLLTLDAEVEIASPRGVRRVPLAAFVLGPRRTALAADEIVVAILVPDLGAAARSSFLKLGARRYLVISIASVAACLTLAEGGTIAAARIAVGACSPVPMRLPELEAALVGAGAAAGAAAGEDIAARVRPEHFAALTPISDVRGPADYRRASVAELTRRALRLALAGTGGAWPDGTGGA